MLSQRVRNTGARRRRHSRSGSPADAANRHRINCKPVSKRRCTSLEPALQADGLVAIGLERRVETPFLSGDALRAAGSARVRDVVSGPGRGLRGVVAGIECFDPATRRRPVVLGSCRVAHRLGAHAPSLPKCGRSGRDAGRAEDLDAVVGGAGARAPCPAAPWGRRDHRCGRGGAATARTKPSNPAGSVTSRNRACSERRRRCAGRRAGRRRTSRRRRVIALPRDPERELTLEHVEPLVLAVVDVQRRAAAAGRELLGRSRDRRSRRRRP